MFPRRCLCLLLFSGLFVIAADLSERPFTFSLDAGASRSFKLPPSPSSRVVAVDQSGIDVTLTLSVGEVSTLFDSPLNEFGTEWVLLEGDPSTTYDLVIQAREKLGPSGNVTVRVEPVKHDLRLEAERAVTHASSLYAQDHPKAWREAIEALKGSVSRWRQLKNSAREARDLYCIAVLSRLIGDPDAALGYAQEALPLIRALDDRFHEAYLFNEMGRNFHRLRDIAEARAKLEQAISLWRQIPYPRGEGISQSNLCLVLRDEGRERECLPCFEKARNLLQQAEAPLAEASVLLSLGRVHDLFAQPEQAIDCYSSASTIFEAADDRWGLAQLHNNMGAFYRRLGRYNAAAKHYHRSLALFRDLGEKRWQARILNNIGDLYLKLDSPNQALTFLEPALTLRREVDDRRGEQITCLNLGVTLDRLAKHDLAHPHLIRALELGKSSKRRKLEAHALSHLARHERLQGRFDLANNHLNAALSILEQLSLPQVSAEVMTKQAQLALDQGQPERALLSLQQAMPIFTTLDNAPGKAHSLYLSALARQALGRNTEAIDDARAAIDLIEGLRSSLDISGLRDAFFGSQRHVYDLLIHLLMTGSSQKQRALEDALVWSEQAKARGLLELIAFSGEEVSGGISDDLRQQLETQKLRVNACANRLRQQKQRGITGTEARDASIELEAAVHRLELAEAKARAQFPDYASIRQANPIAPADIQALTDDETNLLIFSLGDPASYVWLVRPDTIQAYPLPSQVEIEALTRRAYADLHGVQPGKAAQGKALLEQLSGLLLGPLSSEIRGNRLAIVPDGALCYLPFDALPLGDGPLCETYEVVYLPSASVVKLMRISRSTTPPQSLALFADPVFSPEDRRFDKSLIARRSTPPLELSRLPATAIEARSILASMQHADVFSALGFDANRDAVLGSDLSRFRYLHFATHGVIDTSYPSQSCMVLSQFDPSGSTRDGLLRLQDIYNLELNAELVVLSGCETALGREIHGEGLIGLTRGFLYAGANGVIASLWPVPERATSVLMGHLYTGIRDGLSPSSALRAARQKVRGEQRWRHPYYWAAFVYQGDWQPAENTR